MKDVDKGTGQLVREIEQLRHKIAELEASETERRNIQEQLQLSESKYRALVDNANEIIVVVQDNMSKFSNRRAVEITGYSEEELTSRPFVEFVHLDDRKTVLENYSKRLSGDKSTPMLPVRILDKSGNVKWIEFSWSQLIWEGRPALMYLVNDVTEWKKMEQTLVASEAKYRDLAESITDVFFALDENLTYTYWNKANEKLTGIAAKDALGKNINDLFSDNEATRMAINMYRRALATKEPQHFFNDYSLGDREYVFDISAYPTASGLCVYVKDMTERRKLEKALQESEQYYRHIFDSAPFGIGFSSIDGKVVTLNKAMETITGYSAEDFAKVNLADTYVNKDDREPLLQALRQHGGITDYPVKLRRNDGTTYDALLTARLTKIGDKEFVQTICNDVTERKRAEDRLQESEARYRALVELSPEAIFVASEGKHVFINSAGLKLFGASSPDHILGRPVMDFIHPDYREVVSQRMSESMDTGIEAPAIEEKFLRLDGTGIYVEVRAAPLVYQGKPAMQAVVRDISERKRAEEALRRSEQNFRASIENSPLGIRIIDRDGKALYANRALLDIYGYDNLEELEAVPRKQRYTPEGYNEHTERVKKRKRGEYVPDNYEISIVRKDGQVRHLAVSRGEVLWNSERQFQMVYQDITERKLAEEQYRTIIHGAMDGFWQADMQGQFLDVNDAYCSLIGYSRNELMNMRIADVEVTEDLSDIAKHMERIKKIGYDRFETRHRCKNGEIIDVDISANFSPMYGGRMFTFIRDITQRRKMEELVKESEARFRSIVETTREWIWQMDLDGKMTYNNPAFREILGYDQEESIGRNTLDYMHGEDRQRVEQMLQQLIPEKRGWTNLVIRWCHKDGKWRWLESNAVPILDSKGQMLGYQGADRDITERKMAEAQLQQEKDRAQRYLDIAGVILVANDADGRVQMINKKGCDVLGYEQEDIIGKNWFDNFLPASVRHEVKTVFKKLMAGEVEPVSYFENRVLTKNGEERIIAWHNVIMKDLTGDIIGTLSSGEDVTERKKSESRASIQHDLSIKLGAVDNLDEALRICLDAALKISELDCGGIYLVDGESGSLDLAYHKGLSAEFIKSASHYEADSINVRLVMAGKPIYSRHKELGIPLDVVKQCEDLRAMAVLPIFYENHTIGCLNVALRTLDEVPVSSRSGLEMITAQIGSLIGRIKSRQELEKSEERYRLLAENVRDVIWATDMDFRFTYVSPSVKYLGARTAEEVMSLSLGELLTPSSQKLAMKTFAEELAVANMKPYDLTRSRTLEIELVRADGSILWAELKMNFMREPGGRPVGILGVMRDITERKKAEEERTEFELKAQLASHLASVGELSAGVAHEINNPLTGVIGYAELLMQEDVPEHIKKDLEIIHDGAQRVASIVKGLLKFARQTRPERLPVNINEIIDIVLRLRAYELETNNIKVVTDLADDLPVTVADPGQLQQVFLNLIINAETEMKLAHGKGKLVIKTDYTSNNIRISFKDSGPGIAKENLKKIFDPFFTTREVGHGTGLGLSICHGIVSEHGGKIYAESQLGKGATFVVELPIISERRRATKMLKSRRTSKVRTKAKILVVDDELVVRQLLSQILEEEGHKVETTDDGREALKRITQNGYDLIMLDVKLPGLSGSELYERIRQTSLSLSRRVVFITGDIMAADTESFLNRTKVPFIPKPFNIKQLKADVRRFLTTRHPRKTARSRIGNPSHKQIKILKNTRTVGR